MSRPKTYNPELYSDEYLEIPNKRYFLKNYKTY